MRTGKCYGTSKFKVNKYLKQLRLKNMENTAILEAEINTWCETRRKNS
jgi:hypothetical protein